MNSIMLSDAFYNGLPPKPALPIGFTARLAAKSQDLPRGM